MITFLYTITFLSLFLIIYVYIGYPLLLTLLNKLSGPTVNNFDDQYLPKVSLFISCYNEIDVIDEKINNSLSIDYPKHLLEIVVISDGSTDGTDEAAKLYEEKGIKVIRQEGRLGKTSAINLAMETCTSDIVVFSDANAIYQESAIKNLVRHFINEHVGYVVGAALYTDGKESSAAQSEDIYWKYELTIKTLESNLHSVVGGDGAIYAIRKSLYIPLDQKDINDFVNPLQIIAQGFRGVFDPMAICYEETAGDFSKEYKRKKRIVNRSFRGLLKVKTVMNPFKYGFFSFEVISHKLLRWLQPIFIVIFALGALSLGLLGSASFQIVSILGILFLWLAQIGFLKSQSKKLSKVFSIPFYFIMVNFYSLLGVIEALKGNIQVTWSTHRETSNVNNSHSLITKLALISVNCFLLILLIKLSPI